MHHLRRFSSDQFGQQLGFGEPSYGLGALANEPIEFFVERHLGLLPMLVLFQGADSAQRLHELLDHSQDVIAPDHLRLPYTRSAMISPNFRIAVSMVSDQGLPQLMRMKFSNFCLAEKIGPGAMLIPAAIAPW